MSTEAGAAPFRAVTQGSRLPSLVALPPSTCGPHDHPGSRRQTVENHAGDFATGPGSVAQHSHLLCMAQNLGIGTQLNCKRSWEIPSSCPPRNSTHRWCHLGLAPRRAPVLAPLLLRHLRGWSRDTAPLTGTPPGTIPWHSESPFSRLPVTLTCIKRHTQVLFY